jgi:hypothetical protein
LIRNPETDSVSLIDPVTAAYITDARYLPDDPKLIKQTIMDFGAVYSMMYYRKSDLDTLSNICYTNKKMINHAAIITGWNDTMSTADGNGVWIIQNSLGDKFGDKGYFYMPYSDPNILRYNAVWPKWIPYEPGSKVLYYDTLGSFRSYGFSDSVCHGLVKFTPGFKCRLVKVGTSVNKENSRCEATIYKYFDTIGKKTGKPAGYTEELNCRYAGYYTVDLTKPVEIDSNESFYVMMKYISPADTMPLPVETYIEGYSDPHITGGKCWVNPDAEKWPDAWYECGEFRKFEGLNFDLCIKCYVLFE